MRTILYMAQSLNGYIAKENNDTSWIGSSDLRRFQELTTKAGNVVLGSLTYEVMKAEGQFPLPNRTCVVMTHNVLAHSAEQSDQVIFTDGTPGEVVAMLSKKGFEEIMVIGGGKLNKSFLEQDLIDEIYITMEPIIFGQGIHLIDPTDFIGGLPELEVRLELLETYEVSKDEIQLHYRVLKS